MCQIAQKNPSEQRGASGHLRLLSEQVTKSIWKLFLKDQQKENERSMV